MYACLDKLCLITCLLRYMIRVCDVMKARGCMIRCMVGFVYELDRCMVRDV